MADGRNEKESGRNLLLDFCRGLKLALDFPVACTVVGQSAWLLDIAFDGNLHRALTGLVRLAHDGQVYTIGLADVQLDAGSTGYQDFTEYHRWVGLERPVSATASSPIAIANDQRPNLNVPFEAVVMSTKSTSALCRFIQGKELFVLRAKKLKDLVAGVVITVAPTRHNLRGGQVWIHGEIHNPRISASELQLRPLRLQACGDWNPKVCEWDENRLPYARELDLVNSGWRPMFEMETVSADSTLDDIDCDPILEAVALHEAGDRMGATEILMGRLEIDLRCLDAHAHLGHFKFALQVARARRHYEVGVRIGDQAAPPDQDLVLPWGLMGNRPFLRCLAGYGLCLWRQKLWEDAERVFHRLLRLNPTDNQGIRFLLPDVVRRKRWASD